MKIVCVLVVFMFLVPSVTPLQSVSPPAKPRLSLQTTAFEDGGLIPDKYTMAASQGAISPPLSWKNVPEGTASFALILVDPDTAVGKTTNEVLHWLIFNIPKDTRELDEGIAAKYELPDGSMQSLNQSRKIGYLGMGAPAAGPYHHYLFQLYALDIKLSSGPTKSVGDVLKEMDGHILMKAVLVGRFHLP